MYGYSGLGVCRGFDPEELQAMRDSLAATLAKECDSLAVHAHIDGQLDVASRLWRRAVELGWLTIGLPEAHGGLGLGAAGIQMVCRELAAAMAPGGFIATLCGLEWLSRVVGDGARPIRQSIVAGEVSLAIPACRVSDPLAIDGRGLSGRKLMLAGGNAPIAIVPFADGEARGWALVDLASGGLEVAQPELWDRTRTILDVTFDGARPVMQVVDQDGRAGELLGTLMAIAIAADCVGGAQAVTDRTVAYLKERVQFDRPIASFQAIKHRAADLVIRIASQEALLQQAVESYDGGSLDAAMWARLAKAGASEMAAFVTHDCIILFGGIGHTWECDPHIYAKRARLNQFLLADNGALRGESVRSLATAVGEGRTTTEIAV